MITNGFKETEIGWIPEEWQVIKFIETISKKKFEEKEHIKKGYYKVNASYPIVDQGAELISGYTDDEILVHKNELPIIIFRDHTRISKYVDFPFALGADGTKVLKPNQNLFDSKFYYYSLMKLDIPSKGYNRHYRYLKEQKIPLLPLPEQRNIAHILSKIQQAIELQEKIIEKTKELKKSLMAKLFTEGLYGEELGGCKIGKFLPAKERDG